MRDEVCEPFCCTFIDFRNTNKRSIGLGSVRGNVESMILRKGLADRGRLVPGMEIFFGSSVNGASNLFAECKVL